MYIFTSNLRKLTIFIYFFGGFRQHSMKPVSISSIIYRGISPPDNKSRQQKVHWIVSTKKKKKKMNREGTKRTKIALTVSSSGVPVRRTTGSWLAAFKIELFSAFTVVFIFALRHRWPFKLRRSRVSNFINVGAGRIDFRNLIRSKAI